MNQLGFSVGDDSTLRAAARADVVRQAKAQAQQMATAAGVRIGPIESISEDAQNASPPTLTYAAAVSAAAPPIEAGSQDLSVAVDVVFGIG